MSWLHIEHRITDLRTWRATFDRFAEVRRRAGVTSEAIRHVHDDDRSIVIDLAFDTTERAAAFLHFLETEVWAVPANSPALASSPVATVLVEAQASAS